MIDYGDFENVHIHVGQITEVHDFPEARKPAYKLMINFGDQIGLKRSSAQIVANYSPEDLLKRKILAVTNFAPKQIGPFISEVLTLGTQDADGNVLLADPGLDAVIGARLY